MTDEDKREWALRMRILASRMKQMGFHAVAKWLRKNADAAMKWAGRPVPTGGGSDL